jgi:hypothetical protein
LFQIDLHNGGSSKSQNITGIFIKNVLPNSPAGKTGDLKVTRFPSSDPLYYRSWIFLHFICAGSFVSGRKNDSKREDCDHFAFRRAIDAVASRECVFTHR